MLPSLLILFSTFQRSYFAQLLNFHLLLFVLCFIVTFFYKFPHLLLKSCYLCIWNKALFFSLPLFTYFEQHVLPHFLSIVLMFLPTFQFPSFNCFDLLIQTANQTLITLFSISHASFLELYLQPCSRSQFSSCPIIVGNVIQGFSYHCFSSGFPCLHYRFILFLYPSFLLIFKPAFLSTYLIFISIIYSFFQKYQQYYYQVESHYSSSNQSQKMSYYGNSLKAQSQKVLTFQPTLISKLQAFYSYKNLFFYPPNFQAYSDQSSMNEQILIYLYSDLWKLSIHLSGQLLNCMNILSSSNYFLSFFSICPYLVLNPPRKYFRFFILHFCRILHNRTVCCSNFCLYYLSFSDCYLWGTFPLGLSHYQIYGLLSDPFIFTSKLVIVLLLIIFHCPYFQIDTYSCFQKAYCCLFQGNLSCGGLRIRCLTTTRYIAYSIIHRRRKIGCLIFALTFNYLIQSNISSK